MPFRLAARSLLRTPGFLVVAVLTLALGVGSVSSIWSVLRGTLLQPLPYPQPERLVQVDRLRPPYSGPVSRPVFNAWSEGAGEAFAALGAYTPRAVTLSGVGEAERVRAVQVTPGFWNVFAVAPQRGRSFGAEEEESGAQVAVVSHALWQRRFAGDESLVGRDIVLEGESVRVIGILPPAMRLPMQAELARPTHLPIANIGPGRSFLFVVGRLAEGVTREQALAALQPVNAALAEADPPNNADFRAEVVDLSSALTADASRPLWMLLGAAGLVLLIGCANLANLFLARASQRQRSLAIRAALGASRASLIRLTLGEAVLVALLGGALGVGLASVAVPLFLRGAATLLPAHAQPGVDPSVVAASLAASLATVLLFALWPALRAARATPAAALQQETRGGVGRQRSASQKWLIGAEVALSLTLLTGAGLLLESLRRSAGDDLGIRTEGVLSVAIGLVQPPAPAGADGDAQLAWRARHGQSRLVPLVERLRALPGVRNVALADALPTQVVNSELSSVMFPGRAMGNPAGNPLWTQNRYVSASYFDILGIALREGEMYRDDETPVGEQPKRVLVNETFVKRYLAGERAIGTQISNVGTGAPTTIAGVVADSKTFGPTQDVAAEVYLPPSLLHASQVHLALRIDGDAAALVPAVRDALHAFDPAMPVLQLRPLSDAVADTDPFSRFNRDLMLAFSAVALLLTAFGLYAVIAYLVAQRRAELGIRMSMGANAARIVAHVVGQGMKPVLAGVAAGLLGALWLGQVLSAHWFGLAALEPGILGAGVATLALVAVAATLVPAWRATRIAPTEVLRSQ